MKKGGSAHSPTPATGPLGRRRLFFEKGQWSPHTSAACDSSDSSFTRLEPPPPKKKQLCGINWNVSVNRIFKYFPDCVKPPEVISNGSAVRGRKFSTRRFSWKAHETFFFFSSYGVNVAPPPPSINLTAVCVCVCFALRGQLKEENDLLQRFQGEAGAGKRRQRGETSLTAERRRGGPAPLLLW